MGQGDKGQGPRGEKEKGRWRPAGIGYIIDFRNQQGPGLLAYRAVGTYRTAVFRTEVPRYLRTYLW